MIVEMKGAGRLRRLGLQKQKGVRDAHPSSPSVM
jgi:hypothetical protein